MRYIDAEKLLSEIERREIILDKYKDSFEEAACCKQELVWMKDFILSLQQEQESIAEKFARIVRGNLIGIDKEVQQKFENLYFEITGNKMYGGYKD